MRLYAYMFFTICLISCGKPAVKGEATRESVPAVDRVAVGNKESRAPEVPVEELSMDSLVGKWLKLDYDGQVDPHGGYLLIEKVGDDYKGVFVYQGFTRKCKLITENKVYFLIAESGERYKIGRVESVHEREHNGIGLDLIVGAGFEDKDLGFFQREDVLKNLTE